MEDTNPILISEEANYTISNNNKLPESPRLPMEFLSRSWSLPALQLSKAPKTVNSCTTPPILEGESDDHKKIISGNSFSFATSATSQLILERIMSQSDVSPMTSGRPSCSEPPNGIGGQTFSVSSLTAEMFDGPTPTDPISSPLDFDKYITSITAQPLLPPIRVGPTSGGTTHCVGGSVGSKTVGRWLKDRREKKKEELRVHNAQLHAAVSVAAVAAAVAVTAAATATASKSSGKDEQAVHTDMAMASAASLVAAQCVEAAETMGAEREHLASVLSSAVNVQSHGDIMTVTAAAATALRGVATLKARTMKEVCNIAAVQPVERTIKGENIHSPNCETNLYGQNFLGICNEELLARGSELLKRTRTGDLHWKIVSVYIDKIGQVVLKMKSRHIAGTITKKKKKVLIEVCKDLPVWSERRFIEVGGEERRYFGLKTSTNRVIEFECRTLKEYEMWTQGVSKLLSSVNEKKKTSASPRANVYWN